MTGPHPAGDKRNKEKTNERYPSSEPDPRSSTPASPWPEVIVMPIYNRRRRGRRGGRY
jgi:hypothetical protein